MAKRIQKKQIESGVFVETKSTYIPPTADNEHVQKKYVDEEVAKKANVSHTHSWYDITDKPGVTNIPSAYTTEFKIGDIGSVIVPKLPYWVGENKPTYNWSEISGKPSLDFLPLSGGIVNGNITSNNFVKKDSSNEKVLLGDGGDINLSELKNENIKIGGRNLVLNSKVNVTNNNYAILSFLLSEEPKEGEQLTVVLKGQLGNGKRAFTLYNKNGNQELCILQSKGGGIYQATFNWGKDPINPRLVVVYVYDQNIMTYSTIEWIKIERGNVNRVDWTAAPEDLKIGGRNLLIDSNEFKNSWNYNKATRIGTGFVTPRGSQYKNEATKISLNRQEWSMYQRINFDEYGSYVLSGWVKLETATNLLIVVNNTQSAHTIFGKANITGSGWQKFVIPINVTGVLYAHLHLGGYATIASGEIQSDGDVLLWNLKLEKGVIATDWSPAPEDIKNKFDTIIKAGNVTGATDWYYNLDYLGGTIIIETNCVVRLDYVPSGCSGSILKSGNNNVTFSCNGKQIIYTGDNILNGKDGSTATFTIYNNKCYIRISNV